MHRVLGLGLVLVVVLVALHAAFRFHPPEPTFAGRRLTDWLDAGSEPAALAVHEIGPPAAPWILKKLRWEHPRWGHWQIYQNGLRRVPRFLRSALPKPRVAGYDEYKAMTALLETGPQVIPQLNAALKEDNPAVRLTCAMVLDALRQRGVKDEHSLEALRGAEQDLHPEVRREIADVISRAEPPR